MVSLCWNNDRQECCHTVLTKKSIAQTSFHTALRDGSWNCTLISQHSQWDGKHWQGHITINQFSPPAIPVIFIMLLVSRNSVRGKVSRWLDYLSNPVYQSDEKVDHKTCLLEQTNNQELDFQLTKLRVSKGCPAPFKIRKEIKNLD